MKFVLLPGLDGTGTLFEGLIPHLGYANVQVIPFPESGNQSYELLTSYVIDLLPNEHFILVAESFSGPIGALVAGHNIENMRGVVFVATFLSPPKKMLLYLAQLLPVNKLLRLPLSSLIVRYFMLGQSASAEAAKMFFRVVAGVPDSIFKSRLSTVQNFKLGACRIDLPAMYIRAEHDKLVPKEKCLEFNRYFSDIKFEAIDGPHFILQSNPAECAKRIIDRFDF